MDGKGTRRIKASSAAMNRTATDANIVSVPASSSPDAMDRHTEQPGTAAKHDRHCE